MEKQVRRALVVGRSYLFNLCLARSLGAAGYAVEVLRIFKTPPRRFNPMSSLKPDAYSKYVSAYHTCIIGEDENRVVEKLLELARPEQKTLLVTGDDLFTSIVDENLEHLSRFYHISHAGHRPGGLNRLMDKQLQKSLAREAGLPVAACWEVTLEKGQFSLPEGISYPCFVKPKVSRHGQKRTMRRCDNVQQLEACLRRIGSGTVLVEDFLDIKREYSVLGISTREGVIGPGFFGAKQGCHEDRKGVALVGEVLDPGTYGTLVEKILAFVGSLGFEGLFDVDLIETMDGKWYFVELNLRFGGSGHAITVSGVNLPGMYADYVTQGKTIDLDCRVAPGRTFLNEKNLIEEYMKGYLTLQETRRLWKAADICFIRDEADPAPYRHFRKFWPVAFGLRFLYRLKKAMGK